MWTILISLIKESWKRVESHPKAMWVNNEKKMLKMTFNDLKKEIKIFCKLTLKKKKKKTCISKPFPQTYLYFPLKKSNKKWKLKNISKLTSNGFMFSYSSSISFLNSHINYYYLIWNPKVKWNLHYWHPRFIVFDLSFFIFLFVWIENIFYYIRFAKNKNKNYPSHISRTSINMVILFVPMSHFLYPIHIIYTMVIFFIYVSIFSLITLFIPWPHD